MFHFFVILVAGDAILNLGEVGRWFPAGCSTVWRHGRTPRTTGSREIVFVLFDDHAEAPAFQAHQAARGIDADGPDEGLDQGRVEMMLAPFEELEGLGGGMPLW